MRRRQEERGKEETEGQVAGGGTKADERKRIGREKAEGESRRQALVDQLWERSEEGRKDTNRKLSKQNRKEADGKPAVDEGERRRGRKEPGLDGSQL